MASVTFLSSVGGDNSTVTDDSNGTTGLANGGHRLRFVPALAQIVAVASFIVTQATNAAASASSASSSASSASTSASNASTAFINFDKKYLGAKSGDPTLDNQGAALATGALYWNTATAKQRIYTGSAWVDVVASSGAFAANNFIVNDPTDSTKKVNFNVASVPTATTVTLTIPSASGTILTSASGMAPLASPTFTGIATSPQFTSTGTIGLSLTSGTSNVILYNQSGYAPPSFTTRSVGTKIVLFPQLSASSGDHAIGIEGGNGYLWLSVPNASSGFKWYAGITNVATMDGAGNLNANSFTAPSTDIGASSPSRVAVELTTTGLLKWQTLANFFFSTAGANVLNTNRGRTTYLTSNTTAVAGVIYVCNTNVHPIITLPDTTTAQLGDSFDILSWYYPFDDTYYVDLLTPAGVYIAWKGTLVGNGDTLRNNFGPMTLVCSYAQTGVQSRWSIM